MVVLFILVYYAAYHGVSQWSGAFFTSQLPAYGGIGGGGGIGPAIVGTAEVVLIATAIAFPVGVLTAIYLSEFANPRVGKVVTTALEQMAGLPTIICGVFIFGLIVNHNGQSALAAALALAIVQVPLIARATRRVDAARARESCARPPMRSGVANWRTVVGRDPADRRQRHRHRHDPGSRTRRRRDGAAVAAPPTPSGRATSSTRSTRCPPFRL